MNLNEFEKAQIAYNNMQFLEYNTEEILNNFKKIILKNKSEIEKICKIEKINSDFIEKNIFDNNSKTKNNIEQRKRTDNFIVSKFKDSIGVIGIISNGDVYITIELLKKMILTKNSMIFCTNNKMFAITNLIVLYFKQALKLCGCDEECIQVINSQNYDEMYKHNNILKKIIVIGNKNLQMQVLAQSKIEVVVSGYNCFDIYIENVMDFNLIKNILRTIDIELNIYINKEIPDETIEELEIEEYTEVENIEECIRDININSAGYSSSIFTQNVDNANKFLKLVKSKNVFVNASPTAERTFDIKENNLLYTKQIMYKNS